MTDPQQTVANRGIQDMLVMGGRSTTVSSILSTTGSTFMTTVLFLMTQIKQTLRPAGLETILLPWLTFGLKIKT